MSKNKCSWVTSSADSPASYCGKPVKWKMEWDGGEIDSSKVREYDHLCPEHRTRNDRIENGIACPVCDTDLLGIYCPSCHCEWHVDDSDEWGGDRVRTEGRS